MSVLYLPRSLDKGQFSVRIGTITVNKEADMFVCSILDQKEGSQRRQAQFGLPTFYYEYYTNMEEAAKMMIETRTGLIVKPILARFHEPFHLTVKRRGTDTGTRVEALDTVYWYLMRGASVGRPFQGKIYHDNHKSHWALVRDYQSILHRPEDRNAMKAMVDWFEKEGNVDQAECVVS